MLLDKDEIKNMLKISELDNIKTQFISNKYDRIIFIMECFNFSWENKCCDIMNWIFNDILSINTFDYCAHNNVDDTNLLAIEKISIIDNILEYILQEQNDKYWLSEYILDFTNYDIDLIKIIEIGVLKWLIDSCNINKNKLGAMLFIAYVKKIYTVPIICIEFCYCLLRWIYENCNLTEDIFELNVCSEIHKNIFVKVFGSNYKFSDWGSKISSKFTTSKTTKYLEIS